MVAFCFLLHFTQCTNSWKYGLAKVCIVEYQWISDLECFIMSVMSFVGDYRYEDTWC